MNDDLILEFLDNSYLEYGDDDDDDADPTYCLLNNRNNILIESSESENNDVELAGKMNRFVVQYKNRKITNQ